MNSNFDEALRKKDENIIKKAERDIMDSQLVREKLKEVEMEISDKANQIYKITQEKTSIQTAI
jgi:hypothetical protein